MALAPLLSKTEFWSYQVMCIDTIYYAILEHADVKTTMELLQPSFHVCSCIEFGFPQDAIILLTAQSQYLNCFVHFVSFHLLCSLILLSYVTCLAFFVASNVS